MSEKLKAIQKEIRNIADKKKAEMMRRFFKTGRGEYGEGDIFLGISVPHSRKIAKEYSGISLGEIGALLHSKIHEERLVALLLCIEKFKEEKNKRGIYELYLGNTRWINNWDLVDLSADKIVGAYIFSGDKRVLFTLAHSRNMWERRIAMIATLYFIRRGVFGDTLKIAEILVYDRHDLIQKAVGWMLREVGKRSMSTEEKFLKKYYKTMPRMMLRYAIERFPETRRKMYISGNLR
jgi:3-methyladenine DNA glycosylase AlkD